MDGEQLIDELGLLLSEDEISRAGYEIALQAARRGYQSLTSKQRYILREHVRPKLRGNYHFD